MRIIKQLMATLGVSLLLAGCQTSLPTMAPPASPLRPMINAENSKETIQDRYLCAIERRPNSSTIVKIMDLATHNIRSVFVPGEVHHMAGSLETQKLYVSSGQSATDKADHSLYEVDIQTGTIQRILSFSQVGLVPDDLVIDHGKLYTTGLQNNRGALLSYDLKTKGWQPIVYDLKPGLMQWGVNTSSIQVLNFSGEQLTRTAVDVASRQVVATSYSLTNVLGQDNKFYDGSITKNGNRIYASLNNKIERYDLIGPILKRLSPIELKYAEVRYVALSKAEHMLYVSHNKLNRVSLVRFNSDGLTYTLDELAFPGENNELAVF